MAKPTIGQPEWGQTLNDHLDSMAVDTAGKSDLGHTHDDRYFTEAEVTTSLAGKSDTSHTHDDRYFTEAEVTTSLAGKSDTGHTHPQSEVTDLATAWTAYTPTLTNFAATIDLARYKQVGKTVHVVIHLTLTAAPTDYLRIGLPVSSFNYGIQVVLGSVAANDVSTGAIELGVVHWATTSQLGLFGTSPDAWRDGVPFAWASGDLLRLTARYEAA